jgi:hypothetical protein
MSAQSLGKLPCASISLQSSILPNSMSSFYWIPVAFVAGAVAFAIIASCCKKEQTLSPEITDHLNSIFDDIAKARREEGRGFQEALEKAQKVCQEELVAHSRLTQRLEEQQKMFAQERLALAQKHQSMMQTYQQKLCTLTKQYEALAQESQGQKKQITLLEETQRSLMQQKKMAALSYLQTLKRKEEELAVGEGQLMRAKMLTRELNDHHALVQQQREASFKQEQAVLTHRFEALAQEHVHQRSRMEELEQTQSSLLQEMKRKTEAFDKQLQEKQAAIQKIEKELAVSLLALQEQRSIAEQKTKQLEELQQVLAKTQQLLVEIQTSTSSTPISPSSSAHASAAIASSISSAPELPIILPEARSCYRGQLKGRLPHGIGILFYPRNDPQGRNFYQGAFVDGFPHGDGLLVWLCGDKYEGAFNQSVREGIGTWTYTLNNKRVVYRGEFKNNISHGQGVYRRDDLHGEIFVYKGAFFNGFRSGNGKYVRTYIAGDRKYITKRAGVFENNALIICESSEDTSVPYPERKS